MTGRRLGLLVAIVPVYVLLAWLSRELGEFEALSVWYAPAGLALAAYILIGPTVFPSLALGEFIGGIVVFHVNTQFSDVQMVVNACGYAATYGLVGLWLRRRGLIARVDTIRDAAPLMAAGIVVAPACAALFGVAMQEWAGFVDGASYWRAVSIWWVGDAIGIATLTPALLVLALVTGFGAPKLVPPALRTVPRIRFVAELALPAAAAALVFAVSSGNPGLVGLVFASVALIALRYGVAGIALSMVLLSPVVTVMANHRVGEVVAARTDLQVLLLAIMAVGYVLGLVVDERSRLGQYHRELGEIVEATTDFVTVVRRDGSIRYLNPAGREALGFAPDEMLDQVLEEDLYPPGTSAQLAAEARHRAERMGSWQGEVLLRGRDRDIAASKVVIAHYDKNGKPLRTTSVLRDVTEQRRLQEQLERRALFDDLTSLPNRSLFLAQLDRTGDLCRAQQVHASVLVVMLDGDDRSLGGLAFSARDEVLRAVGRRLLPAAGEGAVVARLDGLCFGILPASAVPEPEAVLLGRHLADAVNEPLRVARRTVALTASVGVAEVRPDVSAAEVLRAADVAAHRAQSLGGNRVVCHVESMTLEAQTALQRDALLREVVDKNAFSLVYQTVYDTFSARPVAIEALVRFVEEESPYPVIVVAERNGLIVPLGREILRRACREFAGWSRPGVDVALHVNASACQIVAPGYCDDVHAALDTCGLRPEQLTIEVTESAVGDPTAAAPVFAELRALGVKIAIDDFGTGYSSLAIIDRLPVDEVKLDQSFTQALMTSSRTEALVGGTISLAHQLGLNVVAEGVEELDQLRLLSELGCDRVQGFLVGHPAPLPLLALVAPLPVARQARV
jgi:diguanylate cyclase (GGDEF)-like protein/PAS domain S-box-containing protein